MSEPRDLQLAYTLCAAAVAVCLVAFIFHQLWLTGLGLILSGIAVGIATTHKRRCSICRERGGEHE